MLDMKTIDSKIRKLQKLKELLDDEGTRELIADPELLELMRGVVASNGSGNGNGNKHEPPPLASQESLDDELPAEGSLKRKVLDAARALPGKFNTRDVIEKLKLGGYEFGRDPAIAVNQALRNITKKKGLIRLVRSGSGRIPHIYEAVRKENTSRN
jgi:hypothetical protein